MYAPTIEAPPDEPADAYEPYVSLILPAYNEEENIEQAVASAIPPLESISPDWEIVIVNDASTDATPELAEAIAARHPDRIQVLHFADNRGLGTGMRTGFEHARGQVLIYCDSDLPFEMSALRDAHDLLLERRVDLVNGYRANRGADSPRRRFYTGAYNVLVRAVLGIRVRDVNCPLKLFRREILEAESLQSNGSFIDAELLARARRGGFRIAELPVRYTPRVRGTSTLARPSVIVGILREMALFRVGRLRGRPASLVAAA